MRPAEGRSDASRNRMTGTDAARRLVNKAVPSDKLDEEIQKFVNDLLAGGPNCSNKTITC